MDKIITKWKEIKNSPKGQKIQKTFKKKEKIDVTKLPWSIINISVSKTPLKRPCALCQINAKRFNVMNQINLFKHLRVFLLPNAPNDSRNFTLAQNLACLFLPKPWKLIVKNCSMDLAHTQHSLKVPNKGVPHQDCSLTMEERVRNRFWDGITCHKGGVW